jgi:hypothetical protein
MKSLLASYYTKPLAGYLILALLAISSAAGPAEAMFVPAEHMQDSAMVAKMSGDRAADLVSIQTALESKIVRQKLIDYGLSPQEAMGRVKGLSDGQIHELAAHMNSLQAGGDPADAFFGIMIVALLVVVLVLLLQNRIEVR